MAVYNRVLSILEKTRGSDDEAFVMPLSHLGHSLLEEGRVDEAELSLVRSGFSSAIFVTYPYQNAVHCSGHFYL
jgi:hypothetical protein